MKKIHLYLQLTILILMLLFLGCGTLFVFAAGAGTEDGQYSIATQDHQFEQEKEDAEQLTQFQDINLSKLLIQLILSLLLIILLIYGLVKFLAIRTKLQPATPFRLLGGITLGQNKSVQLVEINQHLYLLGVGNDVRLLDKITDQEEIEAILTQINWLAENWQVSHWFPRLQAWRKKRAGNDFESELEQVLQGWKERKEQERKDQP